MPERLHLLFYDYVEDIAAKRGPHRPDHLAHIDKWKATGRLVMAGAVGDPPHGGVFVFRVEDPVDIDAFADADPYVAAHLVTGRRIEPWTVM